MTGRKSGERSQLWPGVAMALGSAALFGASIPLAKLLLGSVGPWLMAGLLYLGAGIGLAIAHGIQSTMGLAHTDAPLRAGDLPWLGAVILAGGVAGPVLLMFGLARIDAASASLLLNVEGLATMAIAWLAFREHVDRRLLLGAFSILAGAMLLSWQGTGLALNAGALLVVAACLAWGIDNNLTRKLSAADPIQIAMIKGLAAGSVNLFVASVAGERLPDGMAVAVAGAVGFLGYGVSLALFVLALRHLGTARTGAYFSLAPFVGAILKIALLGEPVTFTLVAAGSLMALGLYLHLAERHGHVHEHEQIEHEHRHVHDSHHQHDHPTGDVAEERHTHRHRHAPLVHRHPHYPDLHHQHLHR
ncbi:MAG: DMT family transporter [Rhodospirillales bacterium]